KADAIQPLSKKTKPKPDKKKHPKKTDALKNGSRPVPASGSSDRTPASITHTTALPRSVRSRSPPPAVPNHGHIEDPKLRTQLNRHAKNAARAKTLLQDAALLLTEEPGCVAVSAEGGMEKTWRVGQEEIVRGAEREGAVGWREWYLNRGPYRSRYSRNGRCVALRAWGSGTGHLATLDWQTGTMHAELQLQETCRDIT
ncbi:hypothetical protein HD554DRAFT_1990679, partial [Boletus coccyginus]